VQKSDRSGGENCEICGLAILAILPADATDAMIAREEVRSSPKKGKADRLKLKRSAGFTI
jgi:hypothetical protein